ncbi:hypothetical protein H6802_02710 [Candidatus Nomurabacteria bacterium]|uniref:Uncharacterized protein n=1 Tax=candidate division WWE3 bacterium TaxID=2053526 RepID=A0A955DZR9_UNCKA|nr:hypothetical protein [candidate division WWE3 bacterium]MCB9823846.1 hypothetical protein [Candidatus Nomurabacteria bacterium]MCB9826749.1 hypothetical protein [Candidatus Nomurabacteria bacterium]MCB9827640.1 hypothetical protein [Candidatus Nomurabacteria bacterium]HXK52704.1 hypothetical protein [bacterium]
MLAQLKTIYSRIEALKGPKLLILLFGIFLLFFATGGLLNYFIDKKLINDELLVSGQPEPQKVSISYTGKIVFAGELSMPDEKIKYKLLDEDNNDIIYLYAKDQKLEVSEGLYATVEGTIFKTQDGQDVLEVYKITLKR